MKQIIEIDYSKWKENEKKKYFIKFLSLLNDMEGELENPDFTRKIDQYKDKIEYLCEIFASYKLKYPKN